MVMSGLRLESSLTFQRRPPAEVREQRMTVTETLNSWFTVRRSVAGSTTTEPPRRPISAMVRATTSG